MNTTANPFDPESFTRMFQNADMSKMLEGFKLPGMDLGRLMEAQRKNMDALTAANQAAAAGYQEIARRQTEIFQKTMQDAQARMTSMGEMDPAKQAEMMRDAMEQASANMTEIAEAARRAAEESFSILSQRMQEQMAELSGQS